VAPGKLKIKNLVRDKDIRGQQREDLALWGGHKKKKGPWEVR